MKNRFISLFLTVCILMLISCSDEQKDKNITPVKDNKSVQVFPLKNKSHTSENLNKSAPENNISLSDWKGIKETGILRIIVPYSFQHNDNLPRESTSYYDELKLIVRFTQEHSLTPKFIPTKSFSQMIPLLQQGIGDIIIANLTVTESRKKQVSFTVPVDHSTEQLIVSKSSNLELAAEKLGILKVGVRKNTSFWETITKIKENQPEVEIIELGDKLSADEKFNLIISGDIDAVIEDSNRLSIFNEYRDDITNIVSLGKERPIAWAVRKNNLTLLKQLNRYIKTEKMLQHLPESRLGDFDIMKKHRQLRLITRNNASSYFLWKNQLMGFEYDLIKEFSKQHKINLKVLVAKDYQQMIDWLEKGYGDIVSAGLIKTAEREKLPIKFTEPYLFVQEVIVQRADDKAITSIEDLNNRKFYIRKSSSYWNTLHHIQTKSEHISFSIVQVPESMETEEIIKNVINGKFDLTLADSNVVAIETSWHNNLKISMPLTGEHGQRWLLRKTDKKLQSNLNKFIKKEYKKLFYNVTFNKYFKNSRKLFDIEKREKNNKNVSAYDDLIKSLAKEYNFDWRLISAQVNQESKFNSKAKSWAGAKGLLQVMPRTAQEVGVSKLTIPKNGLTAGLKYMSWINGQLSDELPADVKIWFTLAAYNAGLGHLKDARNLASTQGLNPDRWFGHVEKAFLLLSKPKYYKKARYGYVRGTEPVTYVKNIQALYELYSKKHSDEA